MTNDDSPIADVELPPCFAPSIKALASAIWAMAEPESSNASGVRDAEAHLLTLRANAASNTPGLYHALEAVRAAVRAIEDIARRPVGLVPNRAELLAVAQAHAESAIGLLAAVLRTAKPTVRATTKWISPAMR